MASKKKVTAKGRKATRPTAAKSTPPPARAKSAAKPAKKAARKPAPAAKLSAAPAAKAVAPAAKVSAPAAKTSAPVAVPSAAEALARKIVKYTTSDTIEDHLAEIYTADCVSVEATGDTASGHDGLAVKFEQWRSMQESSSFKARNVLVKGNVIVIEWDGEVKLRDGRQIALSEVAIHEVRGGKIASERFYYDPSVFSASRSQPRIEVAPEPLPPVQPPRGSPPVDPLDL